jgi:hypothetical protein
VVCVCVCVCVCMSKTIIETGSNNIMLDSGKYHEDVLKTESKGSLL